MAERPARRAGAIDSQSVKTCEAGGPRAFDAGKKIKGRKRHFVADTEGHLLAVQVHAVDVQDRGSAAVDCLYPPALSVPPPPFIGKRPPS